MAELVGIFAEGEAGEDVHAEAGGELVGGVAADDVADLVGEDSGDLGLVFGDQQQAAIDVEIAAEDGEGVYLFWIVENLDAVADAGAIFYGWGKQGFGDALDVGLEAAVGGGGVVGLRFGRRTSRRV